MMDDAVSAEDVFEDPPAAAPEAIPRDQSSDACRLHWQGGARAHRAHAQPHRLSRRNTRGAPPRDRGRLSTNCVLPRAQTHRSRGKVVSVIAGATHSLALRSDGTVWAWGNNDNGQLGDGTTTHRLSPVQVPGLTGVVALAAGNSYSMAMLSDGTVRTWGNNNHGQLGNGTTTHANSPGPVVGL
ncbi:hypothetical protein F0U63_33420 [Cystobacter fuscus]|nr:hypothetical protein F0U63_33420 [Cystobacter fuscus]